MKDCNGDRIHSSAFNLLQCKRYILLWIYACINFWFIHGCIHQQFYISSSYCKVVRTYCIHWNFNERIISWDTRLLSVLEVCKRLIYSAKQCDSLHVSPLKIVCRQVGVWRLAAMTVPSFASVTLAIREPSYNQLRRPALSCIKVNLRVLMWVVQACV